MVCSEPGGASAALAEHCARLAPPELAEALRAQRLGDDLDDICRARRVVHLDPALHELDRREDKRRDDPAQAAARRCSDGRVREMAADLSVEVVERAEQHGVFGTGRHNWHADPFVHAEHAISSQAFLETVDGAAVLTRRERLRLEPHLHGVKGVLDQLAHSPGHRPGHNLFTSITHALSAW